MDKYPRKDSEIEDLYQESNYRMMFDKIAAKHYAPLAMIFATTSGMSRSD